jgi:hypothetical protein
MKKKIKYFFIFLVRKSGMKKKIKYILHFSSWEIRDEERKSVVGNFVASKG